MCQSPQVLHAFWLIAKGTNPPCAWLFLSSTNPHLFYTLAAFAWSVQGVPATFSVLLMVPVQDVIRLCLEEDVESLFGVLWYATSRPEIY